jgi:hypothetical protein
MASGGNKAGSPSYLMASLGGQTAIGRTGSTHFTLDHGFHSQAAAALSPVEEESKAVPAVFRLGAIYPNPSNPSATIEYEIPSPCRAVVKIFDLQGRLVRTLVDENQDIGRHEAVWNGRNQNGTRVASGIYLVKMDAKDFSDTRKVTLLR